MTNRTSIESVLRDFIEKAKVEQQDRDRIFAGLRVAAAVFMEQKETLLPPSDSAAYATPYLRNPFFQCYRHPTPELMQQYAMKELSSHLVSSTPAKPQHTWDHRRIKHRTTDRLFVGWTDEQYKLEVDPKSR
jgi:hypothetical protein